jgi:hypothetical protein
VFCKCVFVVYQANRLNSLSALLSQAKLPDQTTN